MGTQVVTDRRLPRSKGYAHGVLSDAKEYLFIAGQIAMNVEGEIVGKGDIITQFAVAIRNFATVLSAAGLQPHHVVKINIFVTDIEAYQARSSRIGELYREIFGKHYLAMTMVQIGQLVRKDCMIEIEGIAAKIP